MCFSVSFAFSIVKSVPSEWAYIWYYLFGFAKYVSCSETISYFCSSTSFRTFAAQLRKIQEERALKIAQEAEEKRKKEEEERLKREEEALQRLKQMEENQNAVPSEVGENKEPVEGASGPSVSPASDMVSQLVVLRNVWTYWWYCNVSVLVLVLVS